MAVNQKAIGCKIDNSLLTSLNAYCKENNLKRNAIINEAIAKYIGYAL